MVAAIIHRSRLMEELIHVPLLLRVPGKREKGSGEISLQPAAPCANDIGRRRITRAFRFSGPQPLGGRATGQGFPRLCDLGMRGGLHESFPHENRMGPRVLSIRESRFKLVLSFDPPAEELYDLEADPQEQTPLTAYCSEARTAAPARDRAGTPAAIARAAGPGKRGPGASSRTSARMGTPPADKSSVAS